MQMRRLHGCVLIALIAGAGCTRSTGTAPIPERTTVSAAQSFAVPKKIAFGVPRRPDVATPALPNPDGRTPRATTARAAFFAGETALSNGVYYLQLPNGTPFGYYAYLPDQRYIYHFDMAYEYVLDANDAQGGVYLYDFASMHWWYTARTFPFPYVYDFTLNALLYYYPDTTQPGRYTSNPRWFYNFATSQIIAMPDLALHPVASPASLTFTATGAQVSQSFTASESQYTGSFNVAGSACAGIATVAPAGQPNVFTVTPVSAGACTLTLSDSNGQNTAVGISVTSFTVIAE
jgi:hypothetical protein